MPIDTGRPSVRRYEYRRRKRTFFSPRFLTDEFVIVGKGFLSLRLRGTWRQTSEKIWMLLCVKWGKHTEIV